jgi:hypothetical protein
MDIEKKVWTKDENGVGSPESDISYSNRLGRANLPYGQTKRQIKAHSHTTKNWFWDDKARDSKATKIQGLALVEWLISEQRHSEAKVLLEKIKRQMALVQVQKAISNGNLSEAKALLAKYKAENK